MSTTRSIRIVIAGEHPIFRAGLRRLLEVEAGFVVVGEVGVGPATATLIHKFQPDILLLGLVGSASRALDVLREIADPVTSVRTVLLTDSVDSPDVIRSLQLGVRGVVLTDSAPDVLIRCIHAVMNDQSWIGGEAAVVALPGLRKLETARRRSKAFGLTKRELEIVRQVVAGLSNKEIAERSAISENTVKSHLTHIFSKLGASNRVELALFAAHHRLLTGV